MYTLVKNYSGNFKVMHMRKKCMMPLHILEMKMNAMMMFRMILLVTVMKQQIMKMRHPNRDQWM